MITIAAIVTTIWTVTFAVFARNAWTNDDTTDPAEDAAQARYLAEWKRERR